MNIKALPSIGLRLFCCFCFVESAVCSTFAERIIRGCFQGVHLSQVHQQNCIAASLATLVYILLRWCTTCYVGVPLATLVHLRQVHPLKAPLKAPPEDTNKTLKQMT